VLRRFHPRRYPPEANFGHVAWLHRFLDRLATTGFPAPRPLRVLNDASTAVVDGAIWEVLSYVPGRALMWDPAVPVESAGALLARFHQASLAISPDEQRPGALPLDDCRPASAKLIADRFHRDLPEAGHLSAIRCVLHADCTGANMLVDGDPPAVVGMIDFTLALLGPPEADISFALWVTGRSEQPAVSLDYARVRAFVAAITPSGHYLHGPSRPSPCTSSCAASGLAGRIRKCWTAYAGFTNTETSWRKSSRP
jgi:Ser/Thr protein kinase RdoA (MazF antagonist)